MKVHCLLSVAVYLLRERTLAAEGGFSGKVDGGEAAAITGQMQGIKRSAGNDPSKAVPAASAAAAAAAAADQTLATCSDDESFSISGLDDGSYDGCYSAIIVGDELWFGLNGETDSGLFFFPVETTSSGTIWYQGPGTLDESTNTINVIADCYDVNNGDVSTTHPADVSQWLCSTTSSTYDLFLSTCGCSDVDSALPSKAVGALTAGGAFLALLGANFLLVG